MGCAWQRKCVYVCLTSADQGCWLSPMLGLSSNTVLNHMIEDNFMLLRSKRQWKKKWLPFPVRPIAFLWQIDIFCICLSFVFQSIYVRGREFLFPEKLSVPAAYTLFDVTNLVAVEMIKQSSTEFRWGISSGRRWYNITSFMQIHAVKNGKQTNKQKKIIEVNTLPSPKSPLRLSRLYFKMSTFFFWEMSDDVENVTHCCGSGRKELEVSEHLLVPLVWKGNKFQRRRQTPFCPVLSAGHGRGSMLQK